MLISVRLSSIRITKASNKTSYAKNQLYWWSIVNPSKFHMINRLKNINTIPSLFSPLCFFTNCLHSNLVIKFIEINLFWIFQIHLCSTIRIVPPCGFILMTEEKSAGLTMFLIILSLISSWKMHLISSWLLFLKKYQVVLF